MTSEQHLAYLARESQRRRLKDGEAPAPQAAINQKEQKLHEEIQQEVARRGWQIVHHPRFDIPSSCVVGSPDFIIFAADGRVISVECKTGTGKLSLDQRAQIAHAEHLGHKIHVVRSFADFLAICDEPTEKEKVCLPTPSPESAKAD